MDKTPPFKKCIREEILGFFSSLSATCAQLQGNPSSRDRALGFHVHRAQSHPGAQIPLPQVLQELLWAQGLFRQGHSGTERKSKRGSTLWSHRDDSCFPSGKEKILRVFSSFKPSPAPSFPTRELQSSFTSTSSQKGELKRDSVQVPGSWSAHTGSWEHPLPALPEVPPLPRHQGIPGKLGFPQEKHSNSLCFPEI